MGNTTRRRFMQIGTGAVLSGAGAKFTLLEPAALLASPQNMAPSDTVRFASIGTGVRGCELLQASLRVPGIECVAVCDLYDSRHVAGQQAVKKNVPGTRNYKEILDRKDVDAVVIAVTDHHHRRVFVDACAAGKDVYCEKPMSHTVDDGFAMIDAAQKNNRIIQIEVTFVEAYWDRNSASGAWVYPIPPDASEQTIDWNAFLEDAPKRPFDPVRFFRWRCFSDYGEGLAGDLFVHLISGVHFITGTNTVAARAQSSGGLFRWKDGRDFPDLIDTFYDYPNFRLAVRCNLNNEGGEFIAFYGTKGTMTIKDATLTFQPQDTRPQPEGYSIMGWPEQMRLEYLQKWQADHPLPAPLSYSAGGEIESYSVPTGYSDVSDHEANFFNAVRSRKKTVENEEFGNRAAIGCHLANFAYFNQSIAKWDGPARKIVRA
jgi:predicted dehydrogenase